MFTLMEFPFAGMDALCPRQQMRGVIRYLYLDIEYISPTECRNRSCI